MKHFGISSLMAGTLMLVLLDAAPIPSSSGCKDKKNDYYRPHSIGTLIPAKPIKMPEITTGKVKDRADDFSWIELTGIFENDGDYDYNDVAEYGIEYRLADTTDSFKQVPAKSIEDDTFTVKLSGLDPKKLYEYRAYAKAKATLNTYHNLTIVGENKQFTIDMSVWNDR